MDIRELGKSATNHLSTFVGIDDLFEGIYTYRKGEGEKGFTQIAKGLGKLAFTGLALYGSYHLLFASSIQKSKDQFELFNQLQEEESLNPSSLKNLSQTRLNQGWEYAENLTSTCTSFSYKDQTACAKASTPIVNHLFETYTKGLRSWPVRGKALVDQCLQSDAPFCQNMGRELIKQSVEKWQLSAATKIIKKCIDQGLSSQTCIESGKALLETSETSQITSLATRCLKKGSPICETFVPSAMDHILNTKSWGDGAAILRKCDKIGGEACDNFSNRLYSLSTEGEIPPPQAVLKSMAINCLGAKENNPKCNKIFDAFAKIASGKEAISFGKSLLKSPEGHTTERINNLLSTLAKKNDPQGGSLAKMVIEKGVPGTEDSVKEMWKSHLSHLQSKKHYRTYPREDLSQVEDLANTAIHYQQALYIDLLKETFQKLDWCPGCEYSSYSRQQTLYNILTRNLENGKISPCNEPYKTSFQSLLAYSYFEEISKPLKIWAEQNSNRNRVGKLDSIHQIC